MPPSRLIVISYLIVILIGGLLIKISSGMSIIDSIFTSTSAITVSGHTVKSTAELPLFSKIVIIILIQSGGIGISTLSLSLAFIFRRSPGFADRFVFIQSFAGPVFTNVKTLLKVVVIFTLIFEILGAIILTFIWNNQLVNSFPFWKKFLFSLFHAISAFCNAGFDLTGKSLIQDSHNYSVILVISVLIIIGGIGFPVIFELLRKAIKRNSIERITTHTRIVLTTTLLLTLCGAFIIFAFEKNNYLSLVSLTDKITVSLFTSITARTAGFTVADISNFSNHTLLFICFLMFVGASPGSAGGGIKTISFAVIVALCRTVLRGEKYVTLFKRTINDEIVKRIVSITFICLAIVISGEFLIYYVEVGKFNIVRILFETVSAFGTVGLSTGITPALSDVSKLIMSAIMFIGKVGVLTFVYSFVDKKQVELRYSEASVMIG